MKRIQIFAMVSLMLLFMTGLWLVDLGCSALALQSAGLNIQAQTLTMTWTPNQIYHIGLILAGMCFYILCALFIFAVLKEEKEKNED